MKSELSILRIRVRELEAECAALRREVEALKPFDAEFLVAQLTGGDIKTNFHDPYDVLLKSGLRLEVKYSHLNKPNPSKTLRWNWSRPMGLSDKRGEYDYLVLVGQKDERYKEQYPDDSRYVFFLVPRKEVGRVTNAGKTIGSMIALNTNLVSAKSPTSRALRNHLVSETEIRALARKDQFADSKLSK
ncbi:MAG TPA: hypothetical protein VGT24_06410 [Candidatus Acidoferrales bacterium]|nr:hypothetical protein [Candidatus Acidoferrales bacterium]